MNQDTASCLPRFIAFIKRYSYSGVAGDNATMSFERSFPDIGVYQGMAVEFEDVAAFKFENPNSPTDTKSTYYAAVFKNYVIDSPST